MNTVAILWTGILLISASGDPPMAEKLAEATAAPRWEIAPQISSFQYTEPGGMKDKGILYGLGLAHTWYRPAGLLRLEGEFAFGSVDYEGSLLDGTPYTMQGNHDFLLNLRLLWGRTWEAEAWDYRFYYGLGYRALNDDSLQDPAGYDRQSNYLYVPLSLKTYHALADHWQLGLGGELDVLLFGLQFSGVGDNGPVVNVQWPGFGLRASVELRHQVPAADLALAPFVQYWWVDESSTSDGWYEPRNNTLQYGLSLIWRF